jgi:hypothetical protein
MCASTFPFGSCPNSALSEPKTVSHSGYFITRHVLAGGRRGHRMNATHSERVHHARAAPGLAAVRPSAPGSSSAKAELLPILSTSSPTRSLSLAATGSAGRERPPWPPMELRAATQSTSPHLLVLSRARHHLLLVTRHLPHPSLGQGSHRNRRSAPPPVML